MEERVRKLEEFVGETKERLKAIETRFEYIATKEDVSMMKAAIGASQTVIIKWYIATTIAVVSIAIAAAKLIH